jgi:hypothetical protein
MKQAAEEITSVDSRRLILAGEGQSDSWIRRLQLERSMRPMRGAVLDIDTQDLLKVSTADNQQPGPDTRHAPSGSTAPRGRSRSAPAPA